MMGRQLVVAGSLSTQAERNSISIAEAFVDVDAAIIVDVSGSMEAQDSRDGQSRWQVAGHELVGLQNTMPGKLAVIAFADRAEFVPSGVLPMVGRLGGGTNLAGALRFAKALDVPGVRFVVISDGQPDSGGAALDIAKTYTNRIDTIYVGPDGGTGAAFLARLAAQSGGETTTADLASDLAEKTRFLLTRG
jgi:hypothetical protein